MTLSLVAVFK